ncbi:hypothetical protein C6P42_003217 [Pichia californica]|nr:hypothetical protein C6P42_003217 [[Candida] californica]
MDLKHRDMLEDKVYKEEERVYHNDYGVELENHNNEEEEEDDDDDDEFYTPGPDSLYNTRIKIADYSITKAQSRLEFQYQQYQNFDTIENLIKRRRYYNYIEENFTLQGTQLISNRFTSNISYSLINNHLAVSSWNGSCYILDPNNLNIINTISNLHPEKISGLQWSPINDSILATGGSDGIINIIQNPLYENFSKLELKGHLSRINDLKFHPIGNLIASASADLTWRLWDIEKNLELYYQEGHTDSVNSISIHPDGSLLASASNDNIIKLWDLRSGKCISNLIENGHIKSIHALDWRLNGYHLASGGSDSQLLIWDIRMNKNISSILAHSKLISNVKFTNKGDTLISTGYDGILSLTSCDNWLVYKKLLTLDKLMACEIIEQDDNNLCILTGGWDRSIKLYNTNGI